jgi:hypothetical protein
MCTLILFPITKHLLLHKIEKIINIMKYTVVLYRGGSIVKHGTQQHENIDDAIELAKKVAMANKGCYTKIARVQ